MYYIVPPAYSQARKAYLHKLHPMLPQEKRARPRLSVVSYEPHEEKRPFPNAEPTRISQPPSLSMTVYGKRRRWCAQCKCRQSFSVVCSGHPSPLRAAASTVPIPSVVVEVEAEEVVHDLALLAGTAA